MDATTESNSEVTDAIMATGEGQQTAAIEDNTEVALAIPVPTDIYGRILELEPENIIIDPDIHELRAWGDSDQQVLSIPDLAQKMSEEWYPPVLLRMSDDGMVLVAGGRRVEAAKWNRAHGLPGFTLRCVVEEMGDDKAFRNAILENVQREGFTEMELARICAKVRQRFGWEGKAGTAAVAEFCGFRSPVNVTQLEKLLKLPEDVQAKIQSGEWSGSTALELTAGVKPDKRVQVANKAEERARARAKQKADQAEQKRRALEAQVKAKREEAEAKAKRREEKAAKMAAKGVKKPQNQKLIKSEAIRVAREEKRLREAREQEEKAKKELERPVVTGVDVRQAAKTVEGALEKSKAPKLAEAVELFQSWIGPAYQIVLQNFAKGFVSWAHGELGVNGDKELEALWDDIADALKGLRPDISPKLEAAMDKVNQKAIEADKADKAEKAKKSASKKVPASKPAKAKSKDKAKDKVKAKGKK